MKTRLGIKFRCKKIIQLNISEQGKLQIRFYDEIGQEDTEYIQGVEPRGVAFLKENFNKFIMT